MPDPGSRVRLTRPMNSLCKYKANSFSKYKNNYKYTWPQRLPCQINQTDGCTLCTITWPPNEKGNVPWEITNWNMYKYTAIQTHSKREICGFEMIKYFAKQSRIQFSSWTEIGRSSWWVCEIRNRTKCQFWPLYKQIVSLQWHNDIIYELPVKITCLYFLDILGINLYRCRFLVLWAKNKQTNLGMHYTRSVLWEQIIPLASYFNWLISWSWPWSWWKGWCRWRRRWKR